jgi:hypothetical protein
LTKTTFYRYPDHPMRKEEAVRPLALVGPGYGLISTLRKIGVPTNSLLIQLPAEAPGDGKVAHEQEIVPSEAGHSPNSVPVQPAF